MNHRLFAISLEASFGVTSVLLLLLGIWYFRPGAARRWLPPREDGEIPWGLREILAPFGLGFVLIPLLVQQVLVSSGFFDWLYPPAPAVPAALLAAAADAAFPAGLPWGPLTLIVERGEILSARRGLWISALSTPLSIIVALLVLRTCPARFDQLGLGRRWLLRQVWVGLIGWITITPFVYAMEMVIEATMRGRPESHVLTKIAGNQPLAVEWFLIVFVAVIAAPVWEEVFFRGMMQRWLARRSWGGVLAMAASLGIALMERGDRGWTGWREGGPVLFVLVMGVGFVLLRWRFRSAEAEAVYGTALFFAVGHSAWPQPIALFVLGLVLGYLTQRTQSLVGPIVLHALFNGVACATLLAEQGSR